MESTLSDGMEPKNVYVCVCLCVCLCVCIKSIYVPCQMGWSRRNPTKTKFVDSVSLSC